MTPETEHHKSVIHYDDESVRRFVLASIIWGAVGMSLGVWIAAQMAFPVLNFGFSFSTFGRLRPLHTNAVIFAFVGNMIFAGVYYSTQRLLKTRMFSDTLSAIHFWGWQAIIVAAAITLPLGMTQSKEYAELSWPIDIAVVIVWVVFAINFFGAIYKRRVRHLYVAIWFYIATIITVAVLYIVNNLALPVFSGIHSYPIYSGVQDALVQWWYGHNAVAFFLTTPILGIMYYFLPKAIGRPVYSYRLSIIHFWALIFLYIWAGPHHLLYTALPEWAQSLGMVFSMMLWAPSWGGMLNGLLTLRGAWDKLRTDPVIKFLIAGVTFYGMATFEGPLLSIKSVSALAHYTDWIIGHVHTGALGWNGFMAAGMFYWLVPRLWGKKMHSKGMMNAHFWLATIGILFYAFAMWASGITQGLMWRALNEDGGLLYVSFVDTLDKLMLPYLARLLGGSMYLTGYGMMIVNIFITIKGGKKQNGSVEAMPLPPAKLPWKAAVFSPAVFAAVFGTVALMTFFVTDSVGAIVMVILVATFAVSSLFFFRKLVDKDKPSHFHHILEGRSMVFIAFTLVAILVGGVAEIVPTLFLERAVPKMGPTQTPYRPLELYGRDIYVREGCYLCHSQSVRPFRSESLRYGAPSTAGEFIYDFPFQWGSKRTGPDLHRVGGKYGDLWHYQHMINPRDISKTSNMPPYAFLLDEKIDFGDVDLKLKAMSTLGVPYTDKELQEGVSHAKTHAKKLATDLRAQGATIDDDAALLAMIAYLQRLGLHPENYWAMPGTEGVQ